MGQLLAFIDEQRFECMISMVQHLERGGLSMGKKLCWKDELGGKKNFWDVDWNNKLQWGVEGFK